MRQAFNFYRSYWEVANELNEKDRLAFYDALLKRQFTGEETELKGLVKLIYLSQKHSIDKQIKGYEDKTKRPLLDPAIDPTQGGKQGPSVQEKGKEKEKEKQRLILFNDFWNLYAKSSDKQKCQDKFFKLKDDEIKSIFETLPFYIMQTPDKTYRKNPLTYLNGKCWNDIDVNKPQIINNTLPNEIWE